MSTIRIERDRIVQILHGEDDLVFGPEQSLAVCMNYAVEVAEGVTFERVLRAYINDPMQDFFNIALICDAAGSDQILREIGEVLDAPVHMEDMSDLDYVYISMDMYARTKKKNGLITSDFPYRWDFHGWGTETWNREQPDEETYTGTFAIEFHPVNIFAHLPFRIETNVDIKGVDGETLLHSTATPSVFELITAIVYEMTFNGLVASGTVDPILKDMRSIVRGIRDEGEANGDDDSQELH